VKISSRCRKPATCPYGVPLRVSSLDIRLGVPKGVKIPPRRLTLRICRPWWVRIFLRRAASLCRQTSGYGGKDGQPDQFNLERERAVPSACHGSQLWFRVFCALRPSIAAAGRDFPGASCDESAGNGQAAPTTSGRSGTWAIVITNGEVEEILQAVDFRPNITLARHNRPVHCFGFRELKMLLTGRFMPTVNW
jgi:hypothetical protein